MAARSAAITFSEIGLKAIYEVVETMTMLVFIRI